MNPTSTSKLFDTKWTIYRSKHWMTLASAALMLAVGCGEPSGGDGDKPITPQPTPVEGATDFVSADARPGEETQENEEPAAPADALADEGARDDDRTVEEGDIYQVIDGTSTILNLNAYRGLQIIDFSNPASPTVVGQVQVTGTPVEMYQVENRVFIMLNNWNHYYRSQHASALPEQYTGGGVIVVDISDQANPQITAQGHVGGWIRSSRLTRGNGEEALFVVANDYQGGSKTYVKSFSVDNAGKLEEKNKLEFDGYVQDIQASADRLMVSRYDWNQSNRDGKSTISLVDISSPQGDMVEGASFEVRGRVANKHNMNIRGDVLRVVSGNSWGNSQNTNFVETFDITDISAPVPIDNKTFGDNEQLFATLFLDNKAFFVTYERVDPFHAFEVTDQGIITEKSEFIVSGWNDFFKPVAAKSRLIGIGKNDTDAQGNRINTMAVSLYDITDLTNANPLIQRAEVELDQSWSEAQWDDRAFSVIEKGTSITAPDGLTEETGLVLLPFSGWNEQESRYISAVQIYTFSKDTLTLRGVMDHGTPVRRSFMADKAQKTTANLSEAELSLFNTTNPAAPTELGRLSLAPNYVDFKIFGGHGVRQQNRQSYYGWWRGNRSGQRQDEIQVVSLAGDVDKDAPVAQISVPAGTQTFKHGDSLVTVYSEYNETTEEYDSDIQIWDMSQPASPSMSGSFTATDFVARGGHYGGYYGGGRGCWDCEDDVAVAGFGYYYGGNTTGLSAGQAMVFPSVESHSEILGRRYVRTTRVHRDDRQYRQGCVDYDDTTGERTFSACTFNQGNEYCHRLVRADGTREAEVCQGGFQTCTQDAQGDVSCQDVEASAIRTTQDNYDYNQTRYWTSHKLSVLDLSNPSAPALATSIQMPADEEATGIMADGDKIYLSYKKPTRLPGDSRPYVRHFFKTIDFSNVSAPVQSAPINVPGTLLAVDQDVLLTQDTLWGNQTVESSINKLKVVGPLAYLQDSYRFQDKQVNQVTMDRAGHALVTHRVPWHINRAQHGNDWDSYDQSTYMSVLDLVSATMDLRSTTQVDNWATLRDARDGRALFQVPGGLVVMNLDDVDVPYAQAYFPTRGWPVDLQVHGDDIFFSGGYYGLYRFDLDEDNLTLP